MHNPNATNQTIQVVLLHFITLKNSNRYHIPPMLVQSLFKLHGDTVDPI